MSGHNKWSTIKRKKGKIDAERGRIFTRLIKEITVAAREGGGDANGNPRLRSAILNAKGANMPADNIDRAIKKGTGELPGVVYEAITYEGYGPGGVALYIEALTDNKNRTVSDIRHAITKYGGNLGESGSVGWMFHRKGSITVPAAGLNEDDLMLTALDAGAEDVRNEGDVFIILTDPGSFESVKKTFEEKSIKVSNSELTMVPSTLITVSGKQAESLLKLLDKLDEVDDIQKLYANFDMDESEMAALTKE